MTVALAPRMVIGDSVARLVGGFNAHDAAVFFNELLAPGFGEKRLACLLVLVKEQVDPARAAAFVDVPDVEAVGVVREELFELHAVFHHPVDRVGRAVHEGAHHAGVSAPVAVVHDHREGLILGKAVVPVLLQLGFNRKDAFAEGAGADHHEVGRHRLVGGEDGRHGCGKRSCSKRELKRILTNFPTDASCPGRRVDRLEEGRRRTKSAATNGKGRQGEPSDNENPGRRIVRPGFSCGKRGNRKPEKGKCRLPSGRLPASRSDSCGRRPRQQASGR